MSFPELPFHGPSSSYVFLLLISSPANPMTICPGSQMLHLGLNLDSFLFPHHQMQLFKIHQFCPIYICQIHPFLHISRVSTLGLI